MMEEKRKIGPLLCNISMAMIVIGFLMMIQPFTILLYTYGFSFILGGVILFNIASHL